MNLLPVVADLQLIAPPYTPPVYYLYPGNLILPSEKQISLSQSLSLSSKSTKSLRQAAYRKSKTRITTHDANILHAQNATTTRCI